MVNKGATKRTEWQQRIKDIEMSETPQNITMQLYPRFPKRLRRIEGEDTAASWPSSLVSV